VTRPLSSLASLPLSSRAKREICTLLVLPLILAGCDRVLGLHPCDGADHIVIDMDTTTVYAIGQLVPLQAHVATAGNKALPATLYFDSSVPAAVQIEGAGARAIFPGTVRIAITGCGLRASMPFQASGP
jgi:hypothetical protein